MSGEKKPESPLTNPVGWIFRASMLLLGAVIALNLAVAYVRPILPWLIGGVALAASVWIAVAVVRWRRSRW
jgi:membrane protein YdbS with pleckstrin-like domain